MVNKANSVGRCTVQVASGDWLRFRRDGRRVGVHAHLMGQPHPCAMRHLNLDDERVCPFAEARHAY